MHTKTLKNETDSTFLENTPVSSHPLQVCCWYNFYFHPIFFCERTCFYLFIFFENEEFFILVFLRLRVIMFEMYLSRVKLEMEGAS